MKTDRARPSVHCLVRFAALASLCFALLFAMPLLAASAGGPEVSSALAVKKSSAAGGYVQDPAALEQARLLLGEEGHDKSSSVARLKKMPREKFDRDVVAWLNSGVTWQVSAAMAAMTALDMVELKPELMKMAETSESWRLFHVLNIFYGEDVGESADKSKLDKKHESDRAALGRLYLQRLNQNVPQMVQMALIEGLSLFRVHIPPAQFKQLLLSPNSEVRLSLVRGFLQNRSDYSLAEQRARFEEIFAARPKQVRLTGMDYFLQLAPAQQKSLGVLLAKDSCEKEPQPEVKTACAKIRALSSVSPESMGHGSKEAKP